METQFRGDYDDGDVRVAVKKTGFGAKTRSVRQLRTTYWPWAPKEGSLALFPGCADLAPPLYLVVP